MKECIEIKEIELFHMDPKRLANGDKLRIIFEKKEDVLEEASLISYRGKSVKAFIRNSDLGNKKIEPIEGVFEVYVVTCRRLSNGDKLRIVLDIPYSKDIHEKTVWLRSLDCDITLETIEEELGLGFDDPVIQEGVEA